MENLILLHGALGSKKQLEELKESLEDKFNVLTLNFEGHGGRPSTKQFSIDLFVQNVLEFMKERSIPSSNFFGYSMGGYVALKLANLYPTKVLNIITLATKFDWTKETVEREIKLLNSEKIEAKVPKFAEILKTLHQPEDWKIVLEKTVQLMINLGNGFKLKEQEIKNISQNTLIGIGDRDQMVSIEESKNISDLLPHGQLRVLPNFEHPIEKVDLNTLTKLISGFIE